MMSSASATAHRPWLDRSSSVDERVELLLQEMRLSEKCGLLFHSMIAAGDLSEAAPHMGIPSAREYVHELHMTHLNLVGSATSARELAAWYNGLQRLAASTRLGIPVTLSSDPRHAFADNPGTAAAAGIFSQWPEPLGLAAIGDASLVEEFADIVRREYLAVGLRTALHPQVDLATEPRWSRQIATFGEDAALAGRLGAAHVRGLQGEAFGSESVSTMTKHFPGGGPQKDGEDPHFSHGREQIYPGGAFDLHLQPFIDLIAAGARQMMPYYGVPIGTEYEEIGFGFNRSVVTELLRQRLGFEGIVCTDWGLVTDSEIFGDRFPARAWGAERLTAAERIIKILDAGADQFGGESCPDLLVELVREGLVAEERVNESARRLLREKFLLGLFDDPFVDEDAAEKIVGNADFRAAGETAQRLSVTLLTNGVGSEPVLPLARGLRIYVEGVDRGIAAEYGTVVDSPLDADVAILRLQAPYDDRGTLFENLFHSGGLDFSTETLERVTAVAQAVPTIVDVFVDRPAILEPVVAVAAAVTVNWGASPRALMDVLTGVTGPSGNLPFDLPRSMACIERSRPDVPFDTEDPLFVFGHGLRYDAGVTERPALRPGGAG